ncbi:ATP-binding protein [Sphingomonas koreensis]|jgi:ATP-dependent DNA helicase RecG|uniref:ATP-binding protein n=1 Tax=Sphingomonas koreensis TaxID=93064 RepID=UPI00234EBA89|nr:ATP-binding protein [Sphingomonas koreensis]MDC7812378.1 ATP-binding protein [Sphingomonas koreensis]
MSDPKLAQRLAKGENATTTFFASAKDAKPIAQVVCGLLNSDEGGTVYVGVDAAGRPLLKDLKIDQARALEAALQGEISPSALYSVSVDALKGGAVLTIDVPPGSDRPYVVGGSVWVRGDKETQPAAAQDIRAMFADAEQASLRWERRISTGMEEQDLDLALVRRLRERAESGGRLVLEDAETELEVLRELSFWRPKGFTQACDVVFAKRPDRRLPQTRVQLLEFLSGKTDDTYEDYRWFEGSAIEIIERMHSALLTHRKNRARFSEGALEREDQPDYHEFALREGIVNALAHRSYESYSGGVKVSIYPDRIEFWNTGKLPPEITVQDLPRKHQSYPINPDIAHAFYLNGFMERTGRGTARIAEACKQIGAPAPVWTEDQGGVTLVLYAVPPESEVQSQLSERQRAFLREVRPGVTVTLAEYIKRFASDITDRHARRELAELESRRYVKKEGQSVATVYRRLRL